jgi:hypothetical protein
MEPTQYNMENICVLFLSFFLVILDKLKLHAAVDAEMAAISNKSTASVEAISSYINANFKTDNDKIRAAFIGLLNISYDVAKCLQLISIKRNRLKLQRHYRQEKEFVVITLAF